MKGLLNVLCLYVASVWLCTFLAAQELQPEQTTNSPQSLEAADPLASAKPASPQPATLSTPNFHDLYHNSYVHELLKLRMAVHKLGPAHELRDIDMEKYPDTWNDMQSSLMNGTEEAIDSVYFHSDAANLLNEIHQIIGTLSRRYLSCLGKMEEEYNLGKPIESGTDSEEDEGNTEVVSNEDSTQWPSPVERVGQYPRYPECLRTYHAEVTAAANVSLYQIYDPVLRSNYVVPSNDEGGDVLGVYIAADRPHWFLINWQLARAKYILQQKILAQKQQDPIDGHTVNEGTDGNPKKGDTSVMPAKKIYCIDIGGNYGFYSYHMASNGCYTYTFEVQPGLVFLETIGRESNKLEDMMEVYFLGLSDKYEPQPFNVMNGGGDAYIKPPASPLNRTANGSSDNQGKQQEAVVVEAHPPGSKGLRDFVVQVTSGDRCLPYEHEYAVAKIDVEGFEVQVLQGLKGLLSAGKIDTLLIEIGPSRWSRANTTVTQGSNQLLKLLKGNNYEAYLILRNSGSCPEIVFGYSSPEDIYLEAGKIRIARVPWNMFKPLMQHMDKLKADCNFYFSHFSMRNALTETLALGL